MAGCSASRGTPVWPRPAAAPSSSGAGGTILSLPVSMSSQASRTRPDCRTAAANAVSPGWGRVEQDVEGNDLRAVRASVPGSVSRSRRAEGAVRGGGRGWRGSKVSSDSVTIRTPARGLIRLRGVGLRRDFPNATHRSSLPGNGRSPSDPGSRRPPTRRRQWPRLEPAAAATTTCRPRPAPAAVLPSFLPRTNYSPFGVNFFTGLLQIPGERDTIILNTPLLRRLVGFNQGFVTIQTLEENEKRWLTKNSKKSTRNTTRTANLRSSDWPLTLPARSSTISI